MIIEKFRGNTRVFGSFWNYMESIQEAAVGDIQMVISPATKASSAATVNAAIIAKQSYEVTVDLQISNAAGKIHNFVEKTTNIEIADKSARGKAAIKGGATTVTFVEGKASVTIVYTGTWVAGQTATLTVTGFSVMGFATGDKTMVDTFVA